MSLEILFGLLARDGHCLPYERSDANSNIVGVGNRWVTFDTALGLIHTRLLLISSLY